ncbi:hypothetical protein GCM10027615_40690 [Plantactinospora veratri]
MTVMRSRGVRMGAAAAALAALLLSAGCASDEGTPSGGSSAGGGSSIKEGLSVAFLPKQVNNPYFTVSDNGGKAAVEEFKGSTRRSVPPRRAPPHRSATSTR